MEDLMTTKLTGGVVSAVIFALVGLIVFAISYMFLEAATPKVNVWKEIAEKQNTALAVFLAAIVIGISLIISAAIHG